MSGLRKAVRAFLAERDGFIRALENCTVTSGDYERWQGHAEARRQLREALERAGIDLTAEPAAVRAEATVKAEALDDFAREMDEKAAQWATPTNLADIPEDWDSHHLIVRSVSQGAYKNAAKDARAAAAREIGGKS